MWSRRENIPTTINEPDKKTPPNSPPSPLLFILQGSKEVSWIPILAFIHKERIGQDCPQKPVATPSILTCLFCGMFFFNNLKKQPGTETRS